MRAFFESLMQENTRSYDRHMIVMDHDDFRIPIPLIR